MDGIVRARVRTALPVGTILINITGSLLLGLLSGLVSDLHASSTLGIVVGTGLLGGYTTFSTASVETVRLVQAGRIGLAVVNALGTMAVCVVAAAVGFAITFA